MGKRKKSSRKPQGPKRSDPLPTVFTCLFCNHERAVTVKVEKKEGVGYLECKICGQKFQCAINYLSAPVDVYSEWVDAADAVAQQNSGGAHPISASSKPDRPGKQVDDDEDDRRYTGDGVVDDDDEYD
ncbi:Elf1-domain-containing protein [Thozetella sp. PMI_491]|nr:Elf1-domain-containing protein [Thozetella sp. PMI_491]